MKKRFIALALAIAFALVLSVAVYAGDAINVTVNGQQVDFAGQGPAIVDGRTLVPVRGVFEMLGFDVNWYPDVQQVILYSEYYDMIVITIGSGVFSMSGEDFDLDVPAQIIDGRTMLPIRAVLESVGYHVGWDAATSAVLISSEPIEEQGEPEPWESGCLRC